MMFREQVAVVLTLVLLMRMFQVSKGATAWSLYIEFSTTALSGVDTSSQFMAQMIGSNGECEEVDLVKATHDSAVGLVSGSKVTWTLPDFYCHKSNPTEETGRIIALKLRILTGAADVVRLYKVALINTDLSYTLFGTDLTEANPQEIVFDNTISSVTLSVPSGINDGRLTAPRRISPLSINSRNDRSQSVNYAAFKFKKTSDTLVGDAIATDYSYIRSTLLCAHACTEDGDCLAFRMASSGKTCKLHKGYGAPAAVTDYYRLKYFGKVTGPASPVT
ncbi:uncharacterized protein LOC135495309 [Lineus longissimus]|uniref:uncharacterized protein LOC135495309 n=1 Tax=Lineus longissimus TaxID=88925 RepID=UPI00315DA09E